VKDVENMLITYWIYYPIISMGGGIEENQSRVLQEMINTVTYIIIN
jgi:hypothetical protein